MLWWLVTHVNARGLSKAGSGQGWRAQQTMISIVSLTVWICALRDSQGRYGCMTSPSSRHHLAAASDQATTRSWYHVTSHTIFTGELKFRSSAGLKAASSKRLVQYRSYSFPCSCNHLPFSLIYRLILLNSLTQSGRSSVLDAFPHNIMSFSCYQGQRKHFLLL